MNRVPPSNETGSSELPSSFFDTLTSLLVSQNETLLSGLNQRVSETAAPIVQPPQTIEAPQTAKPHSILLTYPNTLGELRIFYAALSQEEKTAMRSTFSYLINTFKDWLFEYHWIKESFIKFSLELHGGEFAFSLHGAPMGPFLNDLIKPLVTQNTIPARGALYFFLRNILKITDTKDAVLSSLEKNLSLIHRTSPYFKEFILSICKKNQVSKAFQKSSSPAVHTLLMLVKGTLRYFSNSIEHFFQDDKEILSNTEIPVCLIRKGIYLENVNVYFNEVGFPSFCDLRSHNKFDILITDNSTNRVKAAPASLKTIALSLEKSKFTKKCLILIYAEPPLVKPSSGKPFFELFAKNTSLVTSQVLESLNTASTLAWYEIRIKSYPYESLSDFIKTYYQMEPQPEPKKLQSSNSIKRRNNNDFRLFNSFNEFKTFFLSLDPQEKEKAGNLLSTFFNLYNLWLHDSLSISYFKHCFEIYGGHIAFSIHGKAILSLLERSFRVLQDNNTLAARSTAYYFYRHVLKITDSKDFYLSSLESNLKKLRSVSPSFTNIVLQAAKNNPIMLDPVYIKCAPTHAAIYLVKEALTYFKENLNLFFTPSEDILSNTKIPVSLFSKKPTQIILDTMIFSYDEAGFPNFCDLKQLNSFESIEAFPAIGPQPKSTIAYYLRTVTDKDLQKIATALESNRDLILRGKALLLFHVECYDLKPDICFPYFEQFAKNTGLSTSSLLHFLKNSQSLFWKYTSFVNYINSKMEKDETTNKRELPAEKKGLASQDAKKSKSVNPPSVSIIPLKSTLYEPPTILLPKPVPYTFQEENASGKLELGPESLLRRVSMLSSRKENATLKHFKVFRNAFAQLDALRTTHATEVKPIIPELQSVILQKRLPRGIPNIGNSCYINSVLQLIFNIPEFNSLLKSRRIHINLQDILEPEINALVRTNSLDSTCKTLIHQFLFEVQDLYLQRVYINKENIAFTNFFELVLQQIKEPITTPQKNILWIFYKKAVPELQLKLLLAYFSESYSITAKTLLILKASALRDALFLTGFKGDKTAMQDASEVLEKLLPIINVKADLIKKKYHLESEELLGKKESQTISLIPISLPTATPGVNSNWTLQNIFDLAFSKLIMHDNDPLQIEEEGKIIAETSNWVEKLSLENPTTSHLVFQLKRYSQTGSSYQKNADPFVIPENYILDLSLAFDAPPKTYFYKIKAVIYHHDEEKRPDSGHFTTLIEKEDSWIHFDDEKTSFVNPKDYIEKGYILILEKVS